MLLGLIYVDTELEGKTILKEKEKVDASFKKIRGLNWKSCMYWPELDVKNCMLLEHNLLVYKSKMYTDTCTD